MFEYVPVLNDDKGPIPGLVRFYNVETLQKSTGKIDWSTDILVRTSPEEYFSSQDWLDIAKSQNIELTGRIRFRSYAKEVWDMHEADWHYIYTDEFGERYY